MHLHCICIKPNNIKGLRAFSKMFYRALCICIAFALHLHRNLMFSRLRAASVKLFMQLHCICMLSENPLYSRCAASLSEVLFLLAGLPSRLRASLSTVYSDKPTERATRRTSARMGDKLPSHFSRFRLCDPFHVKSIYSGKNTLISPSILPLR